MPAPYAVGAHNSRGRRHAEPAPRLRSEFQRDRDRIVHCSAFRRLEYKTQVFLTHEGDMFRTRLTHSLEVAQISRTVTRALELNEDLVEAIALAHDLGHTPFGHAGQEALDECLREHGGFEHNLQSLRVVDLLEERYASFPGLNLTFETREGILKHCSRARAAVLGEVGARFLDGTWPSLEAQIANVADEIAYNNHDVDDGLRSGLVSLEQLEGVSLVAEALAHVRRAFPGLDARRTASETIRRVIDAQVTDLVECTRARLREYEPRTLDDVRAAPEPLAGFSASMRTRHVELKRFLHANLYRHARVQRMTATAREIVSGLYRAYLSAPERLRVRPGGYGATHLPRRVADYIAGMTDRFALAEYRRLVGPIELPGL